MKPNKLERSVIDRNRCGWLKKPMFLALLFAVIDFFWLISLHVVAWMKEVNGVMPLGKWFYITDQAMKLWNMLHLPIRRIIEPLFFPVATSHPLTPSDFIFFAYEGICIVQSALIGYVVGLLVLWVMLQKQA